MYEFMHSGGHSEAVASWEFMRVVNSAVQRISLYIRKINNICQRKNMGKYKNLVSITTITSSTHLIPACFLTFVCVVRVRGRGRGGKGRADRHGEAYAVLVGISCLYVFCSCATFYMHIS